MNSEQKARKEREMNRFCIAPSVASSVAALVAAPAAAAASAAAHALLASNSSTQQTGSASLGSGSKQTTATNRNTAIQTMNHL